MTEGLFEFCERNHFFYEARDEKDFAKTAEWMKRNLNHNLEFRLRGIIFDITVLLEGNVHHQRYMQAFERFREHYKDFSSDMLWDYCRHLCKTFEITGFASNAARDLKERGPLY